MTDSPSISHRTVSSVSIPVAAGHVYATGNHGRFVELKRDGFYPRRILDIGANVGQFAMLCRLVWPEAHVTSIEAHEGCRPALSMISDESHIAVLADAERDVTFYVHDVPFPSAGNSYYPDELTDYFGAPLPTRRRATTLSTLLAGKEPYELVKLDTQGSELDIIRGGRDIIRAAQYVLCEMQYPPACNQGAPDKADVEAEILSLGFGEPLLLEWWIEKATGRRINEDWIYRRLT